MTGPAAGGADDLFVRPRVDDEVAYLRTQFPRDVWPGHPNLGETARFWLARHGVFREYGAALSAAALAFREDPSAPAVFRAWLFPRLQQYLGELHGHHHVEDEHYFPVFRAADPRLGRAMDILDADHGVIDGLIHRIAETANAFDAALRAGNDARGGGDAVAAELARTLEGVARHLEDEEDIVMPLILARTERGLGIG